MNSQCQGARSHPLVERKDECDLAGNKLIHSQHEGQLKHNCKEKRQNNELEIIKSQGFVIYSTLAIQVILRIIFHHIIDMGKSVPIILQFKNMSNMLKWKQVTSQGYKLYQQKKSESTRIHFMLPTFLIAITINKNFHTMNKRFKPWESENVQPKQPSIFKACRVMEKETRLKMHDSESDTMAEIQQSPGQYTKSFLASFKYSIK